MFLAMVNHPDFDKYNLKSLRTGIMAGAPCPIELMKRVVSDMHAGEITIAYGMTETSPVSFQSDADDPLDRRGCHSRARFTLTWRSRSSTRTAQRFRSASRANCAPADTR